MTSTPRYLELLAMNILKHEDALEAMMADISALTAAVDRIEGVINDLKARGLSAEEQAAALAAEAVAKADAETQSALDAVTERLNAIGA